MQESEKNIFWFIIFQIAIIFVILFFSILIDKTLLLRCFCCWRSVHFGFFVYFLFFVLANKDFLKTQQSQISKECHKQMAKCFSLCTHAFTHILTHTHTHISSSKCLKNRNQLFWNNRKENKNGVLFFFYPTVIFFFLSGGWAWKREK